MKLKQPYLILFLVLLVAFSCNKVKQLQETEIGEEVMSRKVTNPKVVKLNTNEGYIINQYSGDTIQPIINSFGDTIKTGVPIPVKGKVIHSDSVAKPMTVPVGRPKVMPAHLNVHKVPKNLTVIPINNDSLKTFTTGVDSSPFVLVNSYGDTIPTGIPIPAKGKVVRAIYLPPGKVSPLRSKDNANVNIKYLDAEQGINISGIRDILEDGGGNLWFATRRDGVNKYNGYTFTNFAVKEGLNFNRVSSMIEDSKGNLWFGSMDLGAVMYNGHTFTHFTEKEGLGDYRVWSIFEDSKGNIWFGTRDGGASMYDGNSFTHFTPKEGLNLVSIYSIFEDSKGNLWFGSLINGVSRYDGNSFTHFTQKEGLIDNSIRSIAEDDQGNLWFGCKGGASMYDGNSFTHFTRKEGLSDNYITSITKDGQGNLWFGTIGGGANMYDGSSFTHFTQKEGLSGNIISSITEDNQGNLLFGTDDGGASIYHGSSFAHFTQKEGLNIVGILSMTEDNKGNLWFGSMNMGAFMYNGHTFTHFTEKEGLGDNRVYSIFEDGKDNIWFGSHIGRASMYDGNSFTYFTQKEGLGNNNLWSAIEDSKGSLWFSSYHQGLSVYDGETFIHITEKEGLSNNFVETAIKDRHGNLWFGTYGGGVSKYDGESFTHFTEKEGLSSNFIFSIFEDSRGNLWFGTADRGVCVFNGESFINYAEKEGLSNNVVWSIIEDRDHNIWLGTDNGLNLFAFDQDNVSNSKRSPPSPEVKIGSVSSTFKSPVIYTYGKADGLIGTNFYRNSVMLDSKNRIWWGTRKGLTMLDMDKFKIPSEPPPLQFDQIDIGGKFIDYRNLNDSLNSIITFDGVARYQNYPLKLSLPYDQNYLTFHFSAIDWSAPHKLKYSYKIDELSDKWSEPTNEPKAEYRNLPYGKFTFKVKAIGAAQIWSKPFEYSFNIAPPWWHTWWARTIYGLLFILFILVIVRMRTRTLRKQREQLEDEVESRTIDLKEAQTQLIQSEKMASLGQLTAGIAHEINNPVSFTRTSSFALDQDLKDIEQLIEKYRDFIQKNKLDTKEIEEFEKSIDFEFLLSEINQAIEDIKEGTKRTSEIVKGLREFSHIDHEKMEPEDIHQGMDATIGLLKSKFNPKIKITKSYERSIGLINCHIGQLNQVFLNLLINALYAVGPEGEIIITTSSEGDQVLISIEDNGKGIPEDIVNKIFDPFFTTKKIGEGTGLGLSISHGIIKNHGGTITVKSSIEKGTVFEIRIPKS